MEDMHIKKKILAVMLCMGIMVSVQLPIMAASETETEVYKTDFDGFSGGAAIYENWSFNGDALPWFTGSTFAEDSAASVQAVTDAENGTACERERGLKLDGGLTGIYFNTFLLDKANHGDIYIDDLSVYITETAVNAAPVDYEVRVKDDRTADVVFSDNVDPALFNEENVKLSVSGGPETPADIVDASYFGFSVSLPEISEGGMYRIDLKNIKGLGGMELTKNSVVFPDVPGTYSGAAAEDNVFEAVVGSDTVRVINTAGINGGYTLIVGYYKNSALEKVQSFSGVASERRPEDVFEIDETDGYDVRAFLILDDMSDMFFGQV